MAKRKNLYFGITSKIKDYIGTHLSSYHATMHLYNQTNIFITLSKNLHLFFLFLIILSHYIYAQNEELPTENFYVENGIATNIRSIIQDRSGFLWFTTNTGLYKYDAYNFVYYKQNFIDSSNIIGNILGTIYEDKAGVLWIGTTVGLEKFDRIEGSFKYYKPNQLVIENDASNNIQAICEDKNNMLWIGTFDGLYKFDKATGKFIPYRHNKKDPGSIAHNSVQTIYKDKEETLWFGTGEGLDKLDFETTRFVSASKLGQEKFTHCWQDIRKNYDSSNSKYFIQTICEDNTGTIWLGTNGGLIEYDPKTGNISSYIFNSKNKKVRINTITLDILTGSLWIATYDELINYDKKIKKVTRYNIEGIQILCCEKSGTLWIGTNTEIKKLNRTKQFFKRYSIEHEQPALGIINGTEGILWINTYLGWKKFDIKKEQFVPYSFGKKQLYYIWNSGDLSILKNDGSLFIQDSIGNLKFSLDSSHKNLIKFASWGWKTNRGYLFSTHLGSLCLLNPENNSVKKIRKFNEGINYFYLDTFGFLWIGTYKSKLLCYNLSQDSVIEYIPDSKNLSSISGQGINQILEDKKGRLWFATNTGLNRYDRLTKSFTRFTEENGLASNKIRGMLEDNSGNLWLNTSKSISKFNPEANHFKNYDITYGIEPPVDEIHGMGCKTKNGDMYFGGAYGFTRFHPDSIKDNLFIPPVVITSFKKFDKLSPLSKEIHLSYDENFISFEFAALSYISSERNQYAYKMEGLDKDWVYSGTRRYASYPNLEPGEYIFRVKGSNNDGIWNEAGTSILVIISPPWWKTWWAYSSYACILLFILYGLRSYDLNRISLKNQIRMDEAVLKEREEIDKMKSRFFANISHEFRTPLTLILGPVKQIIERTKEHNTRDELKVVHKNANRLLELVNQMLDLSKLESGNMKLQTSPQNIIPLIKALQRLFCSYAERKRISLKFNSEFDEIIVYIDKDKLEKIITNVLSNALKFTPEGGEVEVTINRNCLSLSESENKGNVISKDPDYNRMMVMFIC